MEKKTKKVNKKIVMRKIPTRYLTSCQLEYAAYDGDRLVCYVGVREGGLGAYYGTVWSCHIEAEGAWNCGFDSYEIGDHGSEFERLKDVRYYLNKELEGAA